MKWIIAVLALALVLQTSFLLSRSSGPTQGPTGSQPPTEYRGLTTDVNRLSTDVAKLKTRVVVLERGTSTPTSTPVPVPHCVVDRERVNVREGPGGRLRSDRHGGPRGRVRCSSKKRSGKLVSVLLCRGEPRLDLRAAFELHRCWDYPRCEGYSVCSSHQHPPAAAAHEHSRTYCQYPYPGMAQDCL